MIKATIDRYLSVDVLHVEENIEVYDRTKALIIEHIFNHIKIINTLETHAVGDLRRLMQHYYGWPADPQEVGDLWDSTHNQLVAETQDLIALLAVDHRKRAAAYEALQIPYLDYRYNSRSLALPLEAEAADPAPTPSV